MLHSPAVSLPKSKSIVSSNLLSDDKTQEDLTALMSPMDMPHLDALMDLNLESTRCWEFVGG